MLIFDTYLPHQFLVTGNSSEHISRPGFINNFDLEAGDPGEDYLYPESGPDYRYFPCQMFEASPAQIRKLSEKTFRCLFFCHKR